jgi:hypothetical protein
LINGTHTGGGDYNVNGGTLGGSGSIQSKVVVSSVPEPASAILLCGMAMPLMLRRRKD